ncbi:MAG: O-antigen translocase [Bacteroidota bacterium]
MFKKIKQTIIQSPLLRVTSFNSVSVVVKMITGLAVSKLTAFFLGPSGVALIGNLRNALVVIHNFSVLGLEKGAVRYAAEYKDQLQNRRYFTTTLLLLGSLGSLLVGVLLWFNASWLSRFIFENSNYDIVWKILALALPFHTFNIFLVSLLKGNSEFKKVIEINIVSHLLNLVLFFVGIYFFDLNGALLAVALISSILFFYTFTRAKKYALIFFQFSGTNLKIKMLKNLGEYSLMHLISSITFPLVFLGIRKLIITQIGEDEAGFWEAINRISNYYMVFVLSVLNLFILPKMAEAKTNRAFKKIVFDFYKRVIPIFSIGLVLVYFLRDFIVQLVFSKEFLPTSELFLWQILGDFFRVITLIMVYQFHAKKMLVKFIATDLFLAIALFLSSSLLIKFIGIQGAVLGHFITYMLYFILIMFMFRKQLLTKLID